MSRTLRLRGLVGFLVALCLSAVLAPAALAKSHLAVGESLRANESISSPSGRFQLRMQPDGNLVIYDTTNWTPRWATYAFGANLRVIMQTDGNVVVYDAAMTPRWNSGTHGFYGATLHMQDDGNLVLYRDGLPIWHPGGFIGDRLTGGDTMRPGAIRRSRNGRFQLQMQGDGNFVLYDTSNWQPRWANYAFGPDLRVQMQADGNLVAYDSADRVRWTSATDGFNGATLVVQDDGNVVISQGGLAVWSLHGYIGGTLQPGQALAPGTIRRSPNGRYKLVMQHDGNLVLYEHPEMRAVWATYTFGAGLRAEMQHDGHFVIYEGTTPRWYTATNGYNGARLEVLNDARFAIYHGATLLWGHSTSFGFGGNNGRIDTDAEADVFIGAFRAAGSDAAAHSLYVGLSAPEQAVVDARMRALRGAGKLVRRVTDGRLVYIGEDGNAFEVESAAVAAQSGIDTSAPARITPGAIADLPVGPPLTASSFAEPGEEVAPLPEGVAARLDSSSYILVGKQNFDFTTSDAEGKVRAVGTLLIYRGRGKRELRRRFEFGSGSKIHARSALPCMWGRMTYGYPLGSVSAGGAVGVSSGSSDDGWFSKCRSGSGTRPTFISLYGVGYTKFLLNSVTLQIARSSGSTEPRKFSTFKKMGWGTVTPV